MGGSVSDLLDVLRRRHWAIDALDSEPLDQTELEERGGVSRSTVGRCLRELETAGLVEETADGYRLTQYGEVVFDVFEQSTDRLAGIGSAADVLAMLPRDTDLPSSLFEDATAYQGVDARERHAELIGAADAIHGWHRIVALDDVELYYEQALGGTTFRVVFAPDLTEQMVTVRSDQFREALAHGDVEVREAETPPYSLLLVEGDRRRLCLGIHASDGVLEGLIETADEAALDWGEERFEERWTDATVLGGA